MNYWWSVAIGGALGAVARYFISTIFPFVPGKVPIATLSVNIVGSFLMAVGFVVFAERAMASEVLRYGLMTGFFGALTTFSTFSIEVLQMIQSGNLKLAFAYGLGSVLLCIVAASVGYALTYKFV